jgi:hypothetical protein
VLQRVGGGRRGGAGVRAGMIAAMASAVAELQPHPVS